MLFSDSRFFIFFAVYFLVHQILPRYLMMGLVVIGSTFFYGYWNPLFIPIPFTLVTFTYFAARKITQSQNAHLKKKWLIFFLAVLFIPLLSFKYLDFFLHTLSWFFSIHPPQKLLTTSLPLGISFITFTLAAYVIDVYSGKFKLEKNFLTLLSSVLFFPHLIAGPIVRPSQLIPQLNRWRPSLSAKGSYGGLLFAVGLLKKVVFADSIAPLVNEAYANIETSLSAWAHLMAFYGFTLQIYCDFSGYTDMALGLSWTLGIRLPRNFNRPYAATSIVDFWTRWHITLSTWLKDYLYIPLGGNRKGFLAQTKNVMITMALGGLWHGANWTFVIWGLFHSLGIICNHSMRLFFPKFRLPILVSWLLTLHFVALGWVFFRAPNLSVVSTLLSGFSSKSWNFSYIPREYLYGFAVFICFALTHRWDQHSVFRMWVMKLPKTVTYALVFLLVGFSIVLSSGNSAEFIYFDF